MLRSVRGARHSCPDHDQLLLPPAAVRLHSTPPPVLEGKYPMSVTLEQISAMAASIVYTNLFGVGWD